jgi:hypothetical protein
MQASDTFTPRSGIPVAKLAIVADRIGQNVVAIDDYMCSLNVTEAHIDQNLDLVVAMVNDLMDGDEAWF